MALNLATNEYAQRLLSQTRTPEQHKVPAKVYFHHFNYAKFHVDLGGSAVKSLTFANHRVITDDKREQDQLDFVADVPGTFIYTLPDSDLEVALQNELRQELAKSVLSTAAAASAVSNQHFDPNQPIVPVQVQHVSGTPLQVQNIVAVPGVGLQHTLSGTQPMENGGGMQFTTPEQQSKPPSSADAAAARLAALTATAKGE